MALTVAVVAAARPAAASAGVNGPVAYVQRVGEGSWIVTAAGKVLVFTSRGRLSQPSWSADGRWLTFVRTAGTERHVWLRRPNGTIRLVTPQTGRFAHPSISPDATRVVFSWERKLGRPRLHVANLATGVIRPVATTKQVPGRLSHPSWSPTGRRILFVRDSGRDAGQVRTVRPDGSDMSADLAGEAIATDPDWSPDGALVVAQAVAEAGGSQLVVMRADGRGVVGTLPVGSSEAHAAPAFSPDGRRIAFHRVRTDRPSGVWTMRVDGGDLRRVAAGATDPAWRPR